MVYFIVQVLFSIDLLKFFIFSRSLNKISLNTRVFMVECLTMGKSIATNKKAYRDYFLTDTFECGIELRGGEVKSIRSGHVNFKDSFARFEKGEILLYNLHIDPYDRAGYSVQEPDRVRRLLLHKKEIKKIFNSATVKNLNLVPTKIYFNNRALVKIEIALGKGKKIYDKRETIKKRKIDRDINRTIRQRQNG